MDQGSTDPPGSLTLSFNPVFRFPKLFCGVQKPRGKLTFRKIDSFHVWHIVSSVAQILNRVDFNYSGCN